MAIAIGIEACRDHQRVRGVKHENNYYSHTHTHTHTLYRNTNI